MKTKTIITDALYLKLLSKQKDQFQKKLSEEKERGVIISKSKELHNKELRRMELTVFEIVYDGEFEFATDPFMASMLHRFWELNDLKVSKPIEKLFSERKMIEDSSRRIKFWRKDDLINQPDEVVLDFIAKLQLYRGISKHWESEKAFQEWQGKNVDELYEVFNANSLPDFAKVEKQLFLMNYINSFGKWEGEKIYLVAFIQKLIGNSFIKRKIQLHKCIRIFFEKRYSTPIAKEFQNNRRKYVTEIHYRPFAFIDEYNQHDK